MNVVLSCLGGESEIVFYLAVLGLWWLPGGVSVLLSLARKANVLWSPLLRAVDAGVQVTCVAFVPYLCAITHCLSDTAWLFGDSGNLFRRGIKKKDILINS